MSNKDHGIIAMNPHVALKYFVVLKLYKMQYTNATII
jgi:hypothetical protein